jgi:transcriptional regulator with XRE-family HTH domain
MSETTINQRVKILIDALKTNQRQFSMRCGVSSSVIFNIVDGKMNKPSFDLLQKILFSFNNISTDWLLLGRGEMFEKGNVNGNLNGNLIAESEAEYKTLKPSEREKELEGQVQHLTGKVEALMAVIKELSVSNTAMATPKRGSKSA